MDSIEVEGKTYEDAIKKASIKLNAEERDLDIEVKEVDTKGILGLLGSKKVRITAKIKQKDIDKGDHVDKGDDAPEKFGEKFLKELSAFLGLSFNIKMAHYDDRLIFLVQSDNGDILIGKDGEIL